MLGKPKYKIGDLVKFTIFPDDTYLEKEIKCVGKIGIVDAYGTFFDNSDVSYDVIVEDFDNTGERMFIKHIKEKKLRKVKNG